MPLGGAADIREIRTFESETMMLPTSKKLRAFSLVELVIVVVIIGVIAAIAVPRISRGAKGAADSALRGSLAGLRNAIDMYAAEHGGKFPGSELADTEATLIAQLTEMTDDGGAVGTTAGTHIYGPYLRGGFPPLPVCGPKGSKVVKLVATAGVGGTGTEGWVYSKDTGVIIANCADTDMDDRTTKYNTY